LSRAASEARARVETNKLAPGSWTWVETAWRGLALGVATVVQEAAALAESSWLHTFDLFGRSQDDPVRRVEVKRSGVPPLV
jgi:hypothetical protein